jgi:hypothetical protein
MDTVKSKMQKRDVKMYLLDVSFENECPSSDGRENPFVSRFLERDTKRFGRTAGLAPYNFLL